MQSREAQGRVPGPSVEELVEKVTNAVLEKLQNQHVYTTTGNGDLSLPATAPAVQGSVVAEAGNSSSPHEMVNSAVLVGTSEQATTAAATVQGSIAAVVNSLAGSSVISNLQSIFVSSDIPIDMSVSDRLKTKIWSHEYVDFGLLLNNKKSTLVFIYVFRVTHHHQLGNQSLHWSQTKRQGGSILLKCGSQLSECLRVTVGNTIKA